MSHKYFNSIITTHRGRRGSIHAFLRSIFNSSRMVEKDSFEIIIADLDTDPKIGKIVNIYKDSLNIKYLKVTLVGVFISSGFVDSEFNTSSHQWYFLEMFL